MWTWTCPNTPNLVHEYHTEEGALLLLSWHVDGLWYNHPELGMIQMTIDCEAEHAFPKDNGEPCTTEGCLKTYVPSSERR